MNKPLILALVCFVSVCSHAQTFIWTGPGTPADFSVECDDNGDSDQEISDYLNALEGSFDNCASNATISWDYSDPGNFDCNETIDIEITAEDGCSNEPDEVITIEVSIVDMIAPVLNQDAENETVECGPDNANELANWITDHADADFDDACSADADLVWMTDPDPVSLNDLVSSCGNAGEISVDFWVEDECGNSSNVTTALFIIEDTTDPSFDDPIEVWDQTFECDGDGNTNDLTAWVNDIMDNIAVSDNCSETSFIESSLVNDWNGSGFTECDGQNIEVIFSIEDECGNTENYTAIATIDDTVPPDIVAPPTDLILQCNPSENDTEIQNWLDSYGTGSYADDCTSNVADITLTNSWSGNVPGCDGSGFETITFTLEDECGNTVEAEADVIVDDFEVPSITSIETNPTPTECDLEEIELGQIATIMSTIIDNASAQDVNDCTLPGDLIWVVSPDPASVSTSTTPDPNCAGGNQVAGMYEFEVFVEDECGNPSAISMVIINIEDTTPPEIPANLPGPEQYECESDVPDPPDLIAPDDCDPVPPIFDEVVDDSDPCNIEITRTWIFEDACGNLAGEHEQIILVIDDEEPEWMGDEDDFLPEDMDIVVANCDEGYTFPNGYFENEAEGDEWPVWPPMEGSEFEDNCGATFSLASGSPPTEPYGEGCTVVQYLVEDECGNQLTHEFEVCIICANCAGGGITCRESCETIPACHTCNIEELLDGFESCTPEWTGGLEDWPSSLCNGAGVPHNMSWFSFVAGGTDLCVEVAPFQCAAGSGSIGLQSGVYDFCEDDDGECIGGDAFCSSGLDPISYGLSDLIVGNTYYLFVDGCNGAECDYTITIEKGFEFVLDTPEEVVVTPSCEQAPGFPPNTFCPNTVLQFDIWHEGDSPSDNGDYDDAGPYNPELSAEFYWTFNPPIEGMSDGSWFTGEDGDGFNIPPLVFDYVTVPTVFEICLEEIIAECSDITCNTCCLEILIQPFPDEMFGPYEVCVEDLLDVNGWDPGSVGEDPNGDGIEWLGADNITLGQVEDAIQNNNGILEFMVSDPECDCPFMQSVQIIPIGNLEPVEVTLYMFDCQFRDEDGDLDEYEWEWPDDEYDLTVDMEDFFFRIAEGSIETDWDDERCDSLLLVTVDTAIVTGAVSSGPCTPTGTEYCFELLLERLEDEHDEHSTINPDYIDMNWIDEMGNRVSTGPCINIMPGQEGLYTVELEYSFIDGAYDETLLIIDECTKEFGPFDLDTGIASPPTINGEDIFCENDLLDKTFVVAITGEGTEYEWTFPAGVTGTLFNQPVNDSIICDFTDYDFQANEPIIVVANTPCGQSPAVEVFVEALPLPVPQFVISTPVCTGELAEANFTGDSTNIVQYIWSTTNYNSGNQSGAGPVNYSSSIAGTFNVSLVVIDDQGCESLPVEQSFEVIEPLTAPVLDCNTTASSISFSWNPIAGATGYEITVLQSPMSMGPFSNTDAETSIDFTGLAVNDIIEIEVYATGDAPCGDGPASSLVCQALDCPQPDWIFNLWSDTIFCVNAPIEAFAYDIEGSGVFNYSSSVPGGIDAAGNVDPTAFPVGIHTVRVDYVYQNGDCPISRERQITVLAEPNATFVPSSTELCLGESITIDDSNVDDVATWDYGIDGSINAMGEVSWTSPGVKTISVSVATPDQMGVSCANNSNLQITVNDTLTFGEITCIDTDLDFVHFDWDDVANAMGYDIEYSVNGGAPQNTNIADSEIIIDMLTPGDEVAISVTALSPNICDDVLRTANCIAVACTPLIFPNPVCSDFGIDFVLFEWENVTGASQFEVSVNGVSIGIQDSTSLFVDGLSPEENVMLEVTALNDLDQCPNVTMTAECSAAACVPLIFSDPICADVGIDFVLFQWENVTGASQFEVSVNGGATGIQDSTTFFVDGLSPGEIVVIEVTALNDLDQCPDVTTMHDCTAVDCPDVSIEFNQVIDPCYSASIGGIQLDDPVVSGSMGTGTGNWNSPFVDAGGVFTPDPNSDRVYMLVYEYVEGQCDYSDVFEFPINIIPTGLINVSDDDICLSETTMVESPVSVANGETALWDFGQGVTANGTGFGPYELSFASEGTYVITLTVQNDGCDAAAVTASIEVDEELVTPNIDCFATNSFIDFDWGDVANVSEYNVEVDGVSQGNQSNSDLRVDDLTEGQTVEITINFLSDNSCELEPLVFSCTTTTCPPSYFDLQDYVTEMCLDGTQMTQQLDIDLINPPSDPGNGGWSGPGISASGLFNPNGVGPGVFNLNYSIEFDECSYDTTVVIELYEAPQITSVNPINPDCYEDNIGGIMPVVTGGTAPFIYQVDNLSPQDFPAFIDVINPGTHQLLVTDANGCTNEIAFEIIAAQEPPLSINGPLSILNTETGEYSFSTTAQNIGDVIWLANGEVICQGLDCDPISILGDDFGDEVQLTVQVIFNEDCFIETSIRVDIFRLQNYYIPNVIAETAQNEKDKSWRMFVSGGEILVKHVRVFDRWGNLVHNRELNSLGDENGEVDLLWDGTWTESDGSGQEVITGVYVYTIELEVSGRQIVEAGDITVIR